MQKIQLYGSFRTGTNYISKLLENNFLVKIHHEGDEHGLNDRGFCVNWKHGPYVGQFLAEEYPTIIVTKNPYSWLVSCYNYWRKYPLGPELENFTFKQFVMASPCTLEGSATVPFMFRAKNLMQYYWNSYYHWTSVRSTPIFVVQYEAVLENAEDVLTQIANAFEFESRGQFENIEKNVLWDVKDDENELRLRHSAIAMDIRDKNFDPSHYNQKKYLEHYDTELLEYIKSEWDVNLGNKLAYAVEDHQSSHI